MNILKTGVTLFLVQFYLPAFGQSIENDLFKNAIETKYFKDEFSVCKIDSSIVLYDKLNILKSGLPYFVCGRVINVTTDSLYSKLSPEKHSKDKHKALVVLYDYKKIGDKYTLFFWRPYSGASISLTYKVSKRKQRLVSHSIGTF